MNLKEIKQPFEVDVFNSPKHGTCIDIVYINDDNERYDLFENLDEESCNIIVALLNMYCFSKIDLTVLDINRLNRIVINQL